MFCGNCGSKIEDGARFCPVCGTAVAADIAPAKETQPAAAEPTYQQPAPAQETQPAASEQTYQQSAPAQETQPAAAEQTYQQPAPVQETQPAAAEQTYQQSAPVQETQPAAVEPTYQQSAPAQETQPAAPEQTYQQPAPVQETQPAAPEQTYQQPAPVQEVQPLNSAQTAPAWNDMSAQPAPAPKKKKSKAGLIAGLTAGAVVIGGGAAGCYIFRNDITRMLKGDKEYARMVTEDSFDKLDDLSAEGNKIVPTVSETFKNAFTAISSAKDSGITTESVFESAAESVADGGLNVTGDSDSSSVGALAENSAVSGILLGILGDNADMGRYFDVIPEGKTIISETSLNIKLGSVFAMINNDTVQQILDAINSTSFIVSVSNGETDHASVGISYGDIEGSAELYTKDGDIVITFPGISEKKIIITKEEIESAIKSAGGTGSDNGGNGEKVTALDNDEIERLRKQIVDVYYDAYDTAEITYTNNVEWAESVKANDSDAYDLTLKGTDVKIFFTYDQLKSMTDKMIDIVRNDTYLRTYIIDNFATTEEEYNKSFDDMRLKEDASENRKFTLTAETLVDQDNKALASRYTLTSLDEKSNAVLVYADDNTTKILRAAIHDGDNESDFNVFLADSSANGTDGRGAFRFTNTAKGETNGDVGFRWDYKNKETKKFLDNDITTGEVTVTPADPDLLIKTISEITGKASENGLKGDDDYNESYDDGTIISDTAALTYEGDLDGIVGKTMLYSESSKMSDMIEGLLGDGSQLLEEVKKLSITIKCDVEEENILTSSLDISLGDIGTFGLREHIVVTDSTSEMPDTLKAIKADDPTVSEIGTEALKWLSGLAQKIDGGNGVLSQAIDKELKKAEVEAAFRKHYAAYGSYSVYNADSAASTIYYDIDSKLWDALSDGYSGTKSGVIKLWFKDGKCEILDNAGISDFSYSDSSLDSVYAEVFFDTRLSNGVSGVTAVLTDKKDDLPDGLPDIFNFIDRVYPWENEEGVIGEFVVGTSPSLYKGTVTTTQMPEDPDSVESLNNIAYLIADEISDMFGSSGNVSDYRSGKEKDSTVVFRKDYSDRWYAESGSSGFKTKFTNDVSECLETVTGSDDSLSDITVAVFVSRNKFVGVAVVPAYYDVGFGKSASLSPADVAAGTYAGFADVDGDGTPEAGYITDENGDLAPVGTYSTEAYNPVIAGNSSSGNNGSSEYDGLWSVVSLNGQTIDELVDTYSEYNMEMPDIYVVISDNELTLYVGDSASASGELRFGEEYDGKPAARLIDAAGEAGWLVVDGTKAYFFDDYGAFDIEMEFEGRDIPDVTGGVNIENGKENPELSDITGKWVGEVGGKTHYMTVSSNGVLAYGENMYIEQDHYRLLNPTESGFDVYDKDYDFEGSVIYSDETDTLFVIADGETILFSREEDAKHFDYMGDWTTESINGLSPEEYAKENDLEFDYAALNLMFGEYAALISSGPDTSVWTVMNATDNFCQIAYDSSMFFDCNYDSSSEKLTLTLRYDDSDDTETYVFVRGLTARG